MPVASNLDWLYHLLGYTLAAAGVLLLLWSLFWDRSRGRKRCPKCWYDMAGVPGLRCPECGREARRVKSFHRTRRKRGAALFAVALMLGAAAIPTVLLIHRPWSEMPTTVLIAALELKGWPRGNLGAGPECAREIAKRCRELSGWQRDFVMRRMARYWAFDYRPEWPANAPMAVRPVDEFWYNDGQMNCTLQARLLNGAAGIGEWVSLHVESGRYNSADWGDGFCELGTMSEGARSMALELRVVHLDTGGRLNERQAATWKGVVSWPVTIRGHTDDIMKPVASPAIDKEIREGFVARERSPFGLHRPGDRVTGFSFVLDGTARSEGVTSAMTVEFVRGTQVIASTSVWDAAGGFGSFAGPTNNWIGELPINDKWREVQALKVGDAGWFVRIRASPGMALRDIPSSKYWSGEVIIPANQIRVLPPER